MSVLEFVGRMNPKPFISLAKEEQMRIEEIKKKLLKEKSGSEAEIKPEPEFTYERDVPNDYE